MTKKILKEDSYCMFESVTVIDLICKLNKDFYPQVFLKECKYKVKETKKIRYITEDIFTSNNDHESDSDSE